MQTVSVIIPAYNEEASILGVLQAVDRQRDHGITLEVIVVDDGSKDRTVEVVKSCPQMYSKLIELSPNGGKGKAVKAGLAQATGDFILIQDADLEYDPADYPRLFSPVLKRDADIVIGSRLSAPPLTRVHYFWQLGGPHITLTYAALKLEKKLGRGSGRAAKAAALLESMFDVLVAGDGELAVLNALEPDSPKVIDGDDHKGAYFMSDAQYDASPWPSRHLVNMSSYHYSIEGYHATSLIAQLGCPFNCGFCGGRNSKSLRVIRVRSVESILAEIESLYRTYGYTGFMFYDDELNVSKSMVQLMNGINDLQARLGVEFRLRGFVKAELLTDQQAEAMYHAGFRWLLCGFEAANPRILENIQKRASLDDNTRAVEIAKRHGLKVKALMSIGHPGESERSALDVRDWLVRMQVDDFDCTIITTYPGTPYYDFAIPHPGLANVWTYTQPQTQDRLHAIDIDFTTTPDYYKGDPDGGYRAFVFTDYLKSEEIVDLRDHIERDVRKLLGIQFNPSRAALRFEHSMGQGLPDYILRSTAADTAIKAKT
jgi:anaerobic magnesium-protoporphyrin IX monomethyl ester cyclase